MIGRFATSTAYRQAVEAHLMNSYGPGRVQRGRKRLSAERLIVRLQEQRPSGFMLKGGFALELRLAGRARATRDLDVVADAEIASDSESILDVIEDACRIDARDGFEFVPLGNPERIAPAGEAVTLRFSVRAKVDHRLFEIVPVDVRTGDFVPPVADLLTGLSLVELAGLAPPKIRAVTLEYHFAEKIHALTRPRPSPNSRIRDLVDLCLLIGLGVSSGSETRRALDEVFRHRATHDVPAELPKPPGAWRDGYATLSRPLPEVPQSAEAAHDLVSKFYRNTRS